ncbi:MAG: hypothetical protein ABEI99_12915 [Halobaculum sp.]
MVGPSRSVEEQAEARTRLKIGFVALVAASGGLVALQVDPTLPEVGAAILGGAVVGFLLLQFLVWILGDLGTPERR